MGQLFNVVLLFLSSFIVGNHGYSFDTKYITVPLDHYSFTTNATFELRYLINDTFHKSDGPIFFYAGNEGDIDMFAQNTGFMFDIAPTFNALIIFCEHRFYGKSLPFGNLSYSSPEYLGYLSSYQALADFVFVINDLQKTNSPSAVKKLPVVAFGGSYGGMLAAYLRMKYTYSVVGAIASSAPIWMFPYMTECDSFYVTATKTFEKLGGKKCSDVIRNSWQIIRNVSANSEGRDRLSEMWELCQALESEDDVNVLTGWLGEIYTSLAEMNYPYDTNFILPLPANPIEKFCDNIQENYNDDFVLLRDLGKAIIDVVANYTGQIQCFNLNQIASDHLGLEGWNFQTCTDMVQFRCSTDRDMFENYDFNFQSYSDNCFDKFGVRPRSIDVPYLEYGGIEISAASNIVFSNGGLDPWSGLGVLETINPTVIAVVSPNGAHHSDLSAGNDLDPDDVKQARQVHVMQIANWLDQYDRRDAEL